MLRPKKERINGVSNYCPPPWLHFYSLLTSSNNELDVFRFLGDQACLVFVEKKTSDTEFMQNRDNFNISVKVFSFSLFSIFFLIENVTTHCQ
jgi:hypothetical protein